MNVPFQTVIVLGKNQYVRITKHPMKCFDSVVFSEVRNHQKEIIMSRRQVYIDVSAMSGGGGLRPDGSATPYFDIDVMLDILAKREMNLVLDPHSGNHLVGLFNMLSKMRLGGTVRTNLSLIILID